MKNAYLAAAALAFAGLALASCGQEPEAPAAEVAPEGLPGVAVTKGRLILPAVGGNPAALYFDLVYTGDKPPMLLRVSVDGAQEAMMHETTMYNGEAYMQDLMQLPLVSGETLKFEPGGKHVMVMGLADTVKEGGKAEVTLTFVGGDKVSFQADVLGAGAER